MFVAFQTGALDFGFPAYRARFALLQDLSRYFQPGFTGLSREEGVLLFAQQRAVFMSTGMWEARGIADLARGKFAVGVMKFPEPARDDPRYGPFLEGPIYEDPRSVLGFSVPRTCAHPEIAVDFLLFMASRQENEKLNRIVGWIPNVVGAKPDPALAAFEPNLVGVYPAMDFNLSGDTSIRWKQLGDLYTVGQITYDELAREFSAFYKGRGKIGFEEAQGNWNRGLLQNEQLRAGLRAEALDAPPGAADALWDRYCTLTTWKQVTELLDHRFLVQMETGALPPPASGPGGYSPRTLEKIRARLRQP